MPYFFLVFDGAKIIEKVIDTINNAMRELGNIRGKAQIIFCVNALLWMRGQTQVVLNNAAYTESQTIITIPTCSAGLTPNLQSSSSGTAQSVNLLCPQYTYVCNMAQYTLYYLSPHYICGMYITCCNQQNQEVYNSGVAATADCQVDSASVVSFAATISNLYDYGSENINFPGVFGFGWNNLAGFEAQDHQGNLYAVGLTMLIQERQLGS